MSAISEQPLRQRTQEQTYVEAFDTLEKNGVHSESKWLRKLRKQAITRFDSLGFPVSRRGNEEWIYTDIRPIARTSFQPLGMHEIVKLTERDLELIPFGQGQTHRLVFVDGRYSSQLSSLSALPKGVTVMELAEALSVSSNLVERHLSRYANYNDEPFTALNTAFIDQGVFIHIPDEVCVEEAIHLVFVFTQASKDVVIYPRVLILADTNSKATIIENYEGISDNRYFSNAVTEMVVGVGATVNHYRIQQHSKQAYHVGTSEIELNRDSSYSSVVFDSGGRLVRNNLKLHMRGKGSSCTLNGLYMVTGSQHVDNQVIIDHSGSYTTARERYKGVLDGKSRSVFHGSIVVREGVEKVDSRQEDKNLLLSNKAEADTKPAFWIYADDVKCAHGAACGQMDDNALFYLRSRGIEEKVARMILVQGFVSPIIDSIAVDGLRMNIEHIVKSTLAQWLGSDR